MPQPQSKTKVPDFIPAEQPDFIPAEDAATPSEPDERNGLQRAFDNLTTVTPEQDAKTPGFLKPLTHFGAGAIQGAGQPFVHPLQTLGGVGDAILHPIDTAKGMVSSADEDPAKMAGNLVGGAVVGGGVEEAPGGGWLRKPWKQAPKGPGTIGRVMEAIPTKAKAGKLFEDVMQSAQNEPVTLSKATMDPLERTQQLAMAGGKPFGTADKLFQRIQTINPLNYREARDFASNMSLSPEEKMGLKKSMRYEVPRLSKAFNEDVGGAAERAGKGPEYRQAMKTYQNASRIGDAVQGLKKVAIPAAVAGLGGTAAWRLVNALRGQ